MKKREQVSVLGIKVDALSLIEAIEQIKAWAETKEKHFVLFSPAHAILGAYDDPKLKEIYNQADLNAPDGMPIAWFVKHSGFPLTTRVYGPDVMRTILACPNYRHYFYGGTEKVTLDLFSKFRDSNGKLGFAIAGVENPPFRIPNAAEEKETIARINAAHPDFLWVGIGSPKQEFWIAKHRAELDVPVILGVGAAFDFLSGNKKQAPTWIQKIGMEWFFRFLSEPKRLFKRYILGYPRFVILILLQILKLRHYE